MILTRLLNSMALPFALGKAGAVLLVLSALAAHAVPETFGADCAPCTDAPSPQIREMLEEWGLDPDEYAVVLTWRERARNGSRTSVRGIRLAPVSGGPAFDVYADDQGRPLSEDHLAALHIAPKEWAVRTLSAGARPAAEPKRQADPRRPAPLDAAAVQPETLRLPTLDHAKLLAEDAAAASGGVKAARRIGAFQDLPEPVWVEGERLSHGAWQPQPGGETVWTVVIEAPGARGQRLRLTRLALPEGAQVVVYNMDAPEEWHGPFASLPEGEEELWTPTCFGERVALACILPPGVDAAEVAIRVERIVHIYADMTTLPHQWKTAGDCNLDFTDYEEWAEIGSGVAGIGSVGINGQLWCTGSLIASLAPGDQPPYFLTAKHCVGTQAEASSIEAYWFYDTASLNPRDVPRTTGGADLLVSTPTVNGTDMAFLRLRNAPPEGAAFLGWTTEIPELGAWATGIHHPQGSYKRISFGELTDRTAYDHEIVWFAGTTEPGSSGSPLLTPEGRIIGQLFGGWASCIEPDEPDFYGRFDVSWPLVEPWLGAQPLPWDVDGSGTIDAVDVHLTILAALGADVPCACDVDQSGRVDAVDVQQVILALLNEVLP